MRQKSEDRHCPGQVTINIEVIRRFFDERPELTGEGRADALGVSERTIRRILRGEQVRPSTAVQIADSLGIDISVVLNGFDGDDQLFIGHPEWQLEEPLGDWETLPNGLPCQTVRLKSRSLSDHVARGKCYDVGGMSDDRNSELHEYFLRHPKIARRLKTSGYFPANYAVFFDAKRKRWWVIDEWSEGHTLKTALRLGPLASTDLIPTMFHVARALQEMHREVFIRRSLTPADIIVRKANSMPMLTNLELSKICDTKVTVKAHLRDDNLYQSPEATKPGDVELTADLYSWGRIFIHAAVGRLPKRGEENLAFDQLSCGHDIKTLLASALSLIPTNRPRSMDPILNALRPFVHGE